MFKISRFIRNAQKRSRVYEDSKCLKLSESKRPPPNLSTKVASEQIPKLFSRVKSSEREYFPEEKIENRWNQSNNEVEKVGLRWKNREGQSSGIKDREKWLSTKIKSTDQ